MVALVVRRLLLKPDIIRRNNHKITDDRRKRLFAIELDFRDLPDDVKLQVIEMINKNVQILKTTDVKFLKIADRLKKYNIRIV